MEIDKFRLIEEVRRRPILWVCQNPQMYKNRRFVLEQWNEIGEILGASASECKRTWQKLRVHFTHKAYILLRRIGRAKAAGTYDPTKKYHTWTYFEHLKFLAKGRRSSAKYDMTNVCGTENFDEIADSIHTDQSTSLPTEGDSDVEFIDCSSSDQTLSENGKHFENTYESDNDIEIIERNSNNIEQTIELDDTDESQEENPNFNSYNLSLRSNAQQNECATISSDNYVIESYRTAKEETEFQFETEDIAIVNEALIDFQENEESSISSTPETNQHSENSNLLVAKNENVEPDQSTYSEDQTSRPPDIYDEDYCFLYSFLTETKQMTQTQKLKFQTRMKSLLSSVFPATSSVNVLEKQLVLPEYTDPDKRFLISFWPFFKSMSRLQKLQFRFKMVDLVLKVSTTEMRI